MDILGIETSCDETAAAIVRDGREVVSNVVYTQIPLHQPYGGVVPEIASRAHVEKISEVVRAALGGRKVDAVAVTYGPGLSPALLVGLNAAKGLAASLGVPLICINHMEAHLHTPFLFEGDGSGAPDVESAFPALGLAISGGHTNWFAMEGPGSCTLLGQTLDDAAGEAFDKAAKLLQLGYPGGPKIDRIAKAYRASPAFAAAGGVKGLTPFPKGRPREGVSALAGLPADLCVSFSGLKTALLRHVQQHPELLAADALEGPYEGVSERLAHVVTSYQEAIVQAVADRTKTALRRGDYRSLILGGGVSLNSRVREALSKVAFAAKVPLLMAAPKFCGDNGAMIAGLAYFRRNVTGDDAFRADVAPSLETGVGGRPEAMV